MLLKSFCRSSGGRNMSAIDWVVCVEQREGPVEWALWRTFATLSTFARILTQLSMSGKLAMSVAIDQQMSSRGGHPHRVRRTAAEVRLVEDSAFHSSVGWMDL